MNFDLLMSLAYVWLDDNCRSKTYFQNRKVKIKWAFSKNWKPEDCCKFRGISWLGSISLILQYMGSECSCVQRCKRGLCMQHVVFVPILPDAHQSQTWSGKSSKQLQVDLLLVCVGRNKLFVTNNGKSIMPWWNQEWRMLFEQWKI